MTQTLRGPGGIRIELDSEEIYPDDPGQGTPAMVYKGNASATFWCAESEGELEGDRSNMVELSAAQKRWLTEQQPIVDKFIRENSK